MIIREIGWAEETGRNVILWELHKAQREHVQMQLQFHLVFDSPL